MNEGKAQVLRPHKDTLFRMLFKDKGNLLSLYNALNETAYTDESQLEITTLENALYMNNSKRHNKFLFPVLVKAINGSFDKRGNEISNVVNYTRMTFRLCLISI